MFKACFVALVAGVVFRSAPAADDVAARIGAFESGLGPAVRIEGEPVVRWTLAERMAHHSVPGVSVAVIHDGEIAWAKGYGVQQAGVDEPIDVETMFSVGSLSKVGAAAVTLRLAESGILDVDTDVNAYLSRWRVSDNGFTAIESVTLRGIMSHSAGLTVDGFPDFEPGEPLPTIIDVLEGRPPAKTDPVIADYVPGSRSRYSGGGTTVEQLVIQEVTGLSFVEAARRHVFEELGMTRSTYENPLPESWANVARAHGPNGQPRALPRGWEAMPEIAASGLWTTPSDYARLVIALIESYRGGKHRFLSLPIARQMMTEVGVSSFGLGPEMNGRGMERMFSHSGANESYKAWMEGHLVTGDGAVIMTNGANGSALRDEVRRAIAYAEGWRIGRAVKVPAVELSDEEMTAFVGLYAVQPATTLAGLRMREDAVAYNVAVDDGNLYLGSAGDDEPHRLIPEGPTMFVEAEKGKEHVEFIRDYSGRISGLRVHESGRIIEAVKVP